IRGVGVETSVAAQRLWKNIIEEEMRRRGKRLPLKDLKTGTQADAKHARILELEPYLAAGKYIVRLTPDTEALRDQLENYPALRHDDLMDAAAYVIQLKRPAPWQSSRHKRATYYNRQLTKAGLGDFGFTREDEQEGPRGILGPVQRSRGRPQGD